MGAWHPAASEAVRRSMQSNVSKGTSPELALRAAFAELGLPPDGLNVRGLPGTPDFVWFGESWAVAGFVHGCYWHRCPRCTSGRPLPGGPNAELWREKFARNVDRRARDVSALEAMGFKVVEVWECDVKRDPWGASVQFMSAVAEASEGH